MKKWSTWIGMGVLAAGIYIGTAVWAQGEAANDHEHDDQPKADAAAATAVPATISDAAKAELNAIDTAFAALDGMTFDGAISLAADVGGTTQNHKANFKSSFAKPSLFRHDVEGDALVGYTGDNAYVLVIRRNVYVSKPMPREKVNADALPEVAANLLSSQNPALLMAVSKEPSAALVRGYRSVEKGPDVDVNGVPHTALVLTNDEGVTTALVDPKSHFLRRVTTDLRPMLEKRGADAVKKAEFVIDYTTLTTGPAPADQQFAWTPPEGSRDVTNNLRGLLPGQGGDGAALAMVGKPAPDFTLMTVAGPPVKLSSLKGRVVVLDFWATWCGPCLQSLPELNAYSESIKDRPITVLAINVEEQKDQVGPFVAEKKWTFTVPLDVDGAVAQSFSVSAFPTTTVVDKAGIVRNVTEGFAPGKSHAALKRVVDELSQ